MPTIVEKFKAQVTENQDPEQRARIKIRCPDFLGVDDVDMPEWVEPCLDWGWFLIPDIDEIVEIEIVVSTDEDEVPYQSAIWDPTVTWRGKRFYGGEDTEAPRPVPEDFKTNYGKRRGFATPAGHILLFDDTEGQEKIRLSLRLSEGGGNEYTFIDFDKSGNIILSNAGDGLVLLGAGSEEAGAAAFLVRGDEWKPWAETHTHPTGTGPSGPPSQPIPPTVLSETTKVK
jgi:hypothetical protein